MKVCKTCKKTKRLSSFYKNHKGSQGVQSNCKKCCDEYEKGYRKTKKYKDYQKKYREQHEEYRAAYSLEYRRINKNIIYERRKRKHYFENYKKNETGAIRKRRLCRIKTNLFILTKKLKRLPCVICGNEKSDAHHYNYDSPLNIIWICRKHHAKLHKNLKINEI